LKEPELFVRLAQTAVTLGNYDITEKCFWQVRAYDKLNFFYATTGSWQKMLQMRQ
jgi:hypothetical protein